MSEVKIQECTRCLYDSTLPGITFDEAGVCSYCHVSDGMEKEYPMGEEGKKKLEELASKIKKDGQGKKYDCVIGVSGGCDSSYLLHLAKKELGLRPLAVHFDNTWNSKIAVENIEKVLKKLDIDLYTYVMDNEEFNDLARSMLRSSVSEIDALTDLAFVSTLNSACEKYGIKYSLIGHAFRTEGMAPLGWFYFDGKYVDSIHKKFGTRPMKRFPNLWMHKFLKWMFLGIKQYRPLNYIEYDKKKIKNFLSEEYGWVWYGGHHQENRYTLFNHFYALAKYNIDFRLVEASAMIRSGQMTKAEAKDFVNQPFTMEKSIIEEVIKRLNITEEELNQIMKMPPKGAKDYPTYHQTFRRMKPFFYIMYKLNLVPKNFYVKYCK